MDLTDWDATRKAVEGVGPIHLLVNNAGVAEITPFLETTKAEMDRYIFQNLRLRGGGGGSRILPECQTTLSQIKSGSKLFDRLSADDTSWQKSLWDFKCKTESARIEAYFSLYTPLLSLSANHDCSRRQILRHFPQFSTKIRYDIT